jgi:hypothetical protein
MGIPRNEIIDLGEYKITIDYDGNGGIDLMILDELNEEIESISISNFDIDEIDDNEGDFDINLN